MISVSGDSSAALSDLNHYLQAFWDTAGLPSEAAFVFELALEEVFMNVVMHGQVDGESSRVEMELVRDGDRVVMTIEDTGIAFDPLDAPAPDIDASIEDRPVGGLGIFLVLDMMDEVSYQRIGSRNRLRMCKRVTGEETAR